MFIHGARAVLLRRFSVTLYAVLQGPARSPRAGQKWLPRYAVGENRGLSQELALAMTQKRAVSINFRGNTYIGEFATEGNMLEVSFAGQTEKRIFRGSDTELHARLLLIEMVGRLSTQRPPPRDVRELGRHYQLGG